VTDAHREQLDGWGVVEADWEQFEENVAEKWGTARPYRKRELEDAAREFLDTDEFAPLEERVRRVAEATGRSRRASEEKNLLTRSAGAARTRVWVSIHPDLKAGVEAFAQENDLPKWEVLTAVVREYNDGGRAQRLRDRLSPEVVTEVENGLADIDAGATDGLSKSERVEIAIAQRLGEQFSEADLADAIDTETSGSDYYHERYAPRVIERKDVKRWEKGDGPDVFLRPETWAAKLTTEIIARLGIDDTNPTTPFSRKEFARAADAAGVEASEENRENLNDYKVRVCARLDYEWNDAAEAFIPMSAGNADPDDTASEESPPADATPGVDGDRTDIADTETDVAAEMDALAAATPLRSDGGEDGGPGR
jgi:hypothetical protein